MCAMAIEPGNREHNNFSIFTDKLRQMRQLENRERNNYYREITGDETS